MFDDFEDPTDVGHVRPGREPKLRPLVPEERWASAASAAPATFETDSDLPAEPPARESELGWLWAGLS